MISSASDDIVISSGCLSLRVLGNLDRMYHEPIRAFPGELDNIDNLHIEVQVGVMRMCACSPKHIIGRLAF